jgi:hypothetical protein
VDEFFPASSGYRKLVVHFTINELGAHAETTKTRRF